MSKKAQLDKESLSEWFKKEIRINNFDPRQEEREVILNSEDTDVGVINEDNAEGRINIGIESLQWYERRHC